MSAQDKGRWKGLCTEIRGPGISTPGGVVTFSDETGVVAKDNPNVVVDAAGIVQIHEGSISVPNLGTGRLQNLLLRSEDFDHAAWARFPGGGTGSVTSNNSVAPDGSVTADAVDMTSATTIILRQLVTLADGGTYTFSCWMRHVSGNDLVSVDLGDGGLAGVNTIDSAWRRYSWTGAAGPSDWVDINSQGGGPTKLEVWGAQLVQGSQPHAYTRTSDGPHSENYGTILNGDLRVAGTGQVDLEAAGDVGLRVDSNANVAIAWRLYHLGDGDTFLEFADNQLDVQAAGNIGLRVDQFGNVAIPSRLYHLGDGDTYFWFEPSEDRIDLVAGNLTMVSLVEDSQSVAHVNPDAADIDFEVRDDVGMALKIDAAARTIDLYGVTIDSNGDVTVLSSLTVAGGSAYYAGGDDVAIVDGGTGASTAAGARSNLGLGTMATQSAGDVSITGGSVSGIDPLAIADGGTGASSQADARENLDIYTSVERYDETTETITSELVVPFDAAGYAGTTPATWSTGSDSMGIGATGAYEIEYCAVMILTGSVSGANGGYAELEVDSGSGYAALPATRSRFTLTVNSSNGGASVSGFITASLNKEWRVRLKVVKQIGPDTVKIHHRRLRVKMVA